MGRAEEIAARGFTVPVIVKHTKSLKHNNIAEVSGQVISEVAPNHECYNQRFFRFIVQTLDFTPYHLPVIITQSQLSYAERLSGRKLGRGSYVILTSGAWRSYNEPFNGRSRLNQCYYGKNLQIVSADFMSYKNNVFLDGYICRGGHPTDPKQIFIRTTPQTSRRIIDVLIAVNRPRGPINEGGFTPTKTDYLPLLFWDELAEEAVKLRIGDRIQVEAIMQNRTYEKIYAYDEDNNPLIDKRVAYELTATKFLVVVEEIVKGNGYQPSFS